MQKATDADGLLTAAHADVMKHCPTLLIFCFASYTAVYGAYIRSYAYHTFDHLIYAHANKISHNYSRVCVWEVQS